MKISALLITIFSLSGCSSFGPSYESINAGAIKGKLVVRWIEPDLFIFTPDKLSPLAFTRANGSVITPGEMITDGGSIPRPMWAFRSYSPWGYAPAFIIHDWLFRAKKCQLPEASDYTLEGAAQVMTEVMKTMMESGKVEKDPRTISLMHAAVVSSFAQKVWDEPICLPVPAAFERRAIFQYEISFP